MGRSTVIAFALLCVSGGLGCAAAQGTRGPPLEFSCAAFPAPVSEADLIDRFGAEAVVADSIIGADDGPFLGTVVHPSSTELTFEVAWSNADSRRASWMRVRGPGSSWTTAEGLRVGQDLRSVEEANGGWPFRLQGFAGEGDRGGSVHSWGRGSFERERDSGSCEELIRFQPNWDTDVPRVVRQVMFKREVSSGHPAMQVVNPQIVEIWLRYPRSVAPAGTRRGGAP